MGTYCRTSYCVNCTGSYQYHVVKIHTLQNNRCGRRKLPALKIYMTQNTVLSDWAYQNQSLVSIANGPFCFSNDLNISAMLGFQNNRFQKS